MYEYCAVPVCSEQYDHFALISCDASRCEGRKKEAGCVGGAAVLLPQSAFFVASASLTMRSLSVTLVLLSLALVPCGITAASPAPLGWVAVGETALPPSQLHRVRLALAYTDAQERALSDTLVAVSDPRSTRYQDYVSQAQLRDMLALSPERLAAVMAYVERLHAPAAKTAELAAHGDYLTLELPIAAVEKAFNVTMQRFVSAHGKATVLRSAAAHSLPAELAPHVALVSHVSDFPPRSSRSRGAAGEQLATCQQPLTDGFPGINVVPSLLYNTYNIDNAPVAADTLATQAVAEFEDAFFYPHDITVFQKQYNLKQQEISIHGPNNPDKGYLGEATLDTEFITAVGSGVPTTDLSYPADSGFALLDWATNVSSMAEPALVQSVSWGGPEQEYEMPWMLRVNLELQKIGARGVTVLAASGDETTGATGDFSCGVFAPTFPGGSPYVTAVGGTFIATDGEQQQCWSYSGGGFSTFWPRPDWQTAAIASYLSSSTAFPDASYWNTTGRAFPDVSALSTNYQIVISNVTGPLSGTSASTPVMAGIVSRLNDRLLRAGKKSLGFLNPLLYQLGGAGIGFDVTAGFNKADNCPAGFAAAPGWDACSGLATPDFPTLVKAVDGIIAREPTRQLVQQ